jgi:two-component system response regulator FixJ
MLNVAQTIEGSVDLGVRALPVLRGTAVLVVDDDVALRPLIALRLRLLGHEVEVASSVPAAIETLEARTIGAVVSDYAMHEATGLELLSYVRLRRLPVPFVLMTGQLTPELGELALGGGAALALEKGDLLDSLPDLFYFTGPPTLDPRPSRHRRRSAAVFAAASQ